VTGLVSWEESTICKEVASVDVTPAIILMPIYLHQPYSEWRASLEDKFSATPPLAFCISGDISLSSNFSLNFPTTKR
jgi:hypothetical protein